MINFKKLASRLDIVFGALSAVLAVALIVLFAVRHHDKQREWTLLENQSRSAAETALRLIDEGDYPMARRVAAAALPKNLDKPKDRPYVLRAEYALWKAWQGKHYPLRGYTGPVTSMAFSLDGKRIILSGPDREVRVLDTYIGTLLPAPLEEDADIVKSVTYCAGSKEFVIGVADGAFRIYDFETDAFALNLNDWTEYAASVACSPDGKKIASCGGDGVIRIRDIGTGELLLGPVEGHAASVAFSPDGKRIISGGDDGTLRFWDAATGEAVNVPMEAHAEKVSAVALSPDGKRIVYGGADNTIRVLELDTDGDPVIIELKNHIGAFACNAFSPDGSRFASAGRIYKSIRIWDTETGELLVEPIEDYYNDRIDDDLIFSIAYSPDGKRIATVSDEGNLRIWDATTGELIAGPLQKFGSRIMSLTFTPDGKKIYSATPGGIHILDADTYELLPRQMPDTNFTRTIAFDSRGKKYATDGGYGIPICIWDAKTGNLLLSGPMERRIWGGITQYSSMAFSPDGSRVISGSGDGMSRIWDAITGEPLTGWLNEGGSIECLAFTPDGKRYFSVSESGHLRIRDAATGELLAGPVKTNVDVDIFTEAFSPDGKIFYIGSYSDKISVWEYYAKDLLKKTRDLYPALTPDERRIYCLN